MTMFAIDTVIDTAAKNTKTVLGYIPHDDIRSNFETLVDAQVTWTKTVWNTTTDLAKLATDSVIKTATEATAKAKK